MKKIVNVLLVTNIQLDKVKRDFDETKYMPFLIKDDKLIKNIMKFGQKSAIS